MAKVQQYDVIILGGGAAGLLCAIAAGQRGRRTLVLDHAEAIGKKILISGGGRANFTNLNVTPANYLSQNPHFAKSALARYTPADFISLVEKHGIPYHEKALGQLFCDRSARDLVDMLARECAEAHVAIQTDTRIDRVEHLADRFQIHTPSEIFTAHSLVIATGGLSIPKMGATGFGYDLARQFGLHVIEPRPALVPFTFSADDRDLWCPLAGVSAEVVVTTARISFREKALITHRGLSGPAILQISSYWQPGTPVALDLAPAIDLFAPMLQRRAARAANAAFTSLRTRLPTRWAERWLEVQLAATPPARDLTNQTIAKLESALHQWRITPAGTEGFAKAEVTAGGVDTAELDARTMQSRKIPGLYFIGEVVDVTGWLGGYNFQWAWASGQAAGRSA